MIEIAKTDSNFEREPLLAPFGFKGSYVTELWQSVALMESAGGRRGCGLGTQSPLWSDADMFAGYGESSANCLMYLLTAYALKQAKAMSFQAPLELLDALLPITYEYGKIITQNSKLRPTWALNALVAVDNAAWQLYQRESGGGSFDDLIPNSAKSALVTRQSLLACIPLISYGVSLKDINKLVEAGHFFLKIKIGSDPDKDGDQQKMVRWDMERISAIHAAVKDKETPYTQSGRILYYLDANGRYAEKDTLLRLLDHAEKIGARERIALLEEPFPEECVFDVSDIPARLAADESAHTDKEAQERIQMGYGAIALKPIAKTLSMSLRIAELAHKMHIPCFCADLTVNPILVDWNKNVAARLEPLPGLKVGVLEANGYQNYTNWEILKSYHPRGGDSWIEIRKGLFHLGEDFYAQSGGIFDASEHYLSLVH